MASSSHSMPGSSQQYQPLSQALGISTSNHEPYGGIGSYHSMNQQNLVQVNIDAVKNHRNRRLKAFAFFSAPTALALTARASIAAALISDLG